MSPLSIFHYLVPLLISIVLMNVILFGVLWKKTKSEYYKLLFQTWIFGFISFLAHMVIPDTGPLTHAIAFSFIFPYSYLLSSFLAKLTDIPVPRRFLFTGYALSIAMSSLLSILDAPSPLIIFPITIAAAAGPVMIAQLVIRKRWQSISIIVKLYTAILLLDGIHNLDYVLVFDNLHLVTAGFTYGTALTIGFTVFGLAAVLEKTAEDKARLELKLMYKAQMSHAAKLAAVGEMAAGVAHEINNPLQIIQGLAEMIGRAYKRGEASEEYVLKKIDRLKVNTHRIAEIVAGLILFSRDGSHDPIQSESLKRILDRTMDLYGRKIRDGGISLRENTIDPLLKVDCRIVETSQVIANLLNNANDAVRKAEERWIEIAVKDEGDEIRLIVRDSGPGIPESIQDKIFQPFFSTKEVDAGTGLGLSIAKGIAQSQGGDLYLDPYDKNTSFVLKLLKSSTVQST